MKILKKIIIILIITSMFFASSIIFADKSKAATTYPIQFADLYSKGEIDGFYYKNISVGVQFVVYKKDGVEYPAYCLDRNRAGVTEGSGYTVKIEKARTIYWK